MAELDVSQHTLNNSTSKHKFSFPKSQRFATKSHSACDNYYQLPSTRSCRSTTFGFGHKTLGIHVNKFVPPIGSYNHPSEFNPEVKRGFSFGKGRDEMQLSGPLNSVKLHKDIPGPGRYDVNKSCLVMRATSMKSRLPDYSKKYLEKIPGPGAYPFEELGNELYYVNSKHCNQTHRRFSSSIGLQPLTRKTETDLGPGSYAINRQDLNGKGKYALSNHTNTSSKIFDKGPRTQLIHKHMLFTPGPGKYNVFCTFGNV